MKWQVLFLPQSALGWFTHDQRPRAPEHYARDRITEDAFLAGFSIAKTRFVGALEHLLKVFVACGLPIEKLTFAELLVIIGDDKCLQEHLGRIALVRRLDRELLAELYDVGQRDSIDFRVVTWNEADSALQAITLGQYLGHSEPENGG